MTTSAKSGCSEATKRRLLSFIFLLLTGGQQPAFAESDCPPKPYDKAALAQLKQAEFSMEDDKKRNQLAVGLLGCIGSPDPVLRDGIAYEAIATWLRSDQIDDETWFSLFEGLLGQLESNPDDAGFRQPFAALVLSEVARADRIEARLDDKQRQQFVDSAANYLANVRDYRGFSNTEGWRHGVAHGADLALQLALNPAIDAAQLKALLAAVADQVSPQGEVFYIYGEPSRLARVVFYAHRRAVLNAAYWKTWFSDLASPSPMAAWQDAFKSQSGLAKRHNTLAFLENLHLSATSSTEESAAELDQWVIESLQEVLN